MQIPTHLFDEEGAVPVPLNRGDLVIMNKRTVHGSLPNISDDIRWSFDLRYQPIGEPTGRDIFPGFVARSNDNPDQVLDDPNIWFDLWESTRDNLAKQEQFAFNRWDGEDVACA